MDTDVAIIGAGPAGLALACALSGSGLRVTLLERAPEAAIADPAFDGREIALTHRSQAILRALGASKRDIAGVFNAETLIVGFVAGAGVGLFYVFEFYHGEGTMEARWGSSVGRAMRTKAVISGRSIRPGCGSKRTTAM